MFTHTARRWFAGLGMAGALVAATAAPALAAENDLRIEANNVDLEKDGGAGVVIVDFFAGQERSEIPAGAKIAIDRAGVDGFATVAKPSGLTSCTEAGSVATCDLQQEDFRNRIFVKVSVKESAELGDMGELPVTLTLPTGETAAAKSVVEVVEGVDLRAPVSVQAKGAPGRSVPASLRVSNAGDTTIRGVDFMMYTQEGPDLAQRHSNCFYLRDRYAASGVSVVYCRFETDIAAGADLRTDDSFALKIAADSFAPAAVDHGEVLWGLLDDPTAPPEESTGVEGDWEKGSGSPLTLVPVDSAAATSSRQVDRDVDDNLTYFSLIATGDQGFDLAVRGAEVTGAVGATVAGTVGYVNHGPAALNTGEHWSGVEVTVPAGATVVEAPAECRPGTADVNDESGDAGEPGARRYFCARWSKVAKDEVVDFTFKLRIDKAGTTSGPVRLVHFVGGEKPATDLNATNDAATLVVTGTAASGNGGGDAGDGNGGAGAGDGDGGTLPITGSSTALIAGVGVLLLAAGVGGYVVARRRRTRFVA